MSDDGREDLLAPTFLFRFAAPCLHRPVLWSDGGLQLEQRYTLACFGELEGRSLFADVRAAWSEAGLSFTARVSGKKQLPWCRQTRIDDSDGLQVFIDTRDTHSVHRARRFCHRFIFMPMGGGRRLDEPVAEWLPIARARENPKTVDNELLRIRSEKRIDGYLLEAHLPAEVLTGFDVDEHLRLGFTYALIDRERGWQTFTVGPEFPILEDPSLWGTLELERP